MSHINPLEWDSFDDMEDKKRTKKPSTALLCGTLCSSGLCCR